MAIVGHYLGTMKFLDAYLTAVKTFVSNGTAVNGEFEPSAGCTGCLSAPASGSDNDQRIGRRINVVAFDITGVVYNDGKNSSANLQLPVVYLALVRDKETNGVALASENVYSNLTGLAAAAITPVVNRANIPRYEVIKEEWMNLEKVPWSVGNAASANHPPTYHPFKWTIRFCEPVPVHFNSGTTANATAVVDNSWHLIGYSNTASSNVVVNLLYSSRMFYYDQ